jgi:hypothetical protein
MRLATQWLLAAPLPYPVLGIKPTWNGVSYLAQSGLEIHSDPGNRRYGAIVVFGFLMCDPTLFHLFKNLINYFFY